MKNLRLYIFLSACCCFLFQSCQEKEIIIPDLKVGDRKVLIEELTGVRCPNCPDGTATLVALDSIHNGNLIIVAVHAAGTFSFPYVDPPANKYDFRFPEAQIMADYIGTPEGFPTIAVNRTANPNSTTLFLPPGSWGGAILQEAVTEPLLGIFLEPQYDTTSRELITKVKIAPAADLTGDFRLTVLITQDSIVDVQQVNSVRVADYVHRHVLKKILSLPTGDLIKDQLKKGSVIDLNYNFILPDDWDARHCAVVAFVHQGSGQDKNVLQAEEAEIGDY